MPHRRVSQQCPTAEYPCSVQPRSIFAAPNRKVSLRCPTAEYSCSAQQQSIPIVPSSRVSTFRASFIADTCSTLSLEVIDVALERRRVKGGDVRSKLFRIPRRHPQPKLWTTERNPEFHDTSDIPGTRLGCMKAQMTMLPQQVPEAPVQEGSRRGESRVCFAEASRTNLTAKRKARRKGPQQQRRGSKGSGIRSFRRGTTRYSSLGTSNSWHDGTVVTTQLARSPRWDSSALVHSGSGQLLPRLNMGYLDDFAGMGPPNLPDSGDFVSNSSSSARPSPS